MAGFLGALKLAYALCTALCNVGSVYLHAGPDAAVTAARNMTHRP